MSDHELIEQLEETGEYLVSRRVDLSAVASEAEVNFDFSLRTAVVLDLQTTGTDPTRHAIIEIAMREVHFDEHFQVIALGSPQVYLENPGEPLTPDAARITDLTDEDLAGQEINAPEVARTVMRAGLIISHNAQFDRGFFEARFPQLRDLPWACSCCEVAWHAHGFDGRGLKALLSQAGWFPARSHRAAANIDALIALLRVRFPDSARTVLSELLEIAGRATWRVEAIGASYDVRSDLKDRGYRWDPQAYLWWREVEENVLVDEQRWLLANVYAPRHGSTAKGPHVQKITSRERHR